MFLLLKFVIALFGIVNLSFVGSYAFVIGEAAVEGTSD
jgi:nitrate reductase NapE component